MDPAKRTNNTVNAKSAARQLPSEVQLEVPPLDFFGGGVAKMAAAVKRPLKVAAIVFVMSSALLVPKFNCHAARSSAALTPVRNTVQRGPYIIETIGDTLHQARPENTRLIIRITDTQGKKMVKPESIALIDKTGSVIRPVHREDRKVGHEENTGLPFSINSPPQGSGLQVGPLGVDLNKVFGPKGTYAYTKVDWPREVFTGDKQLQIVLPGGQSFLLALSSLAR